MGAAGAGGGYTIDNSLRFEDGDSPYLSRTPTSTGNTSTWTWSGWIKRGNINTYGTLMEATDGSGSESITLRDNLDNSIIRGIYWTSPASSGGYMSVPPLLRDPAGWFHFILTRDGTTVVAYINGVSVPTLIHSAFSSGGTFNTQVEHRIGLKTANNTALDGYLAEVNFIDGQALTPSDFGETGDYGEWKPIRYTGTYGTNGFYLDFKTAGTGTTGAGKDVSGEGNHWASSGIASTDQMIDTPTNNFATLNPLQMSNNDTNFFVSEGSLRLNSRDNNYNRSISSTFSPPGNKGYFEILCAGSSANFTAGFEDALAPPDKGSYNTSTYDTIRLNSGGNLRNSGTTILSGLTSAFAIGNIMMVAFDFTGTNRNVWFGRNDVWGTRGTIGVPSTGAYPHLTTAELATTKDYRFYFAANTGSGASDIVLNFGQDSSFAGNKTAQGNQDGNGIGDFFYAPPSGFLALCTANLPDVDVIPSEHFNTVTYSGNGYPDSGTQSITTVGFQPDFTWIKNRPRSGYNHFLFDSVRGATKVLRSNVTNTEGTESTALTTWLSNGFSLGANNEVNHASDSHVAWNWKANGSGSSNTNGSITSTVSANTDAGFSIVSYTGNATSGATVGHGLSSAPEMVIVKCTSFDRPWVIYNENTDATNPEDYRLSFDTTARNDDLTVWNDTKPTPYVFTLGNATWTNKDTKDFIAYCFHSVDGYSKVGSYTGNGSADGTFVFTGFRPAYVLIRKTAGDNWNCYDNARSSTGNPFNETIYLDTSGAEGADDTGHNVDFLSNGFKLRATNTQENGSGSTYIFLAFAETPFKYANAR